MRRRPVLARRAQIAFPARMSATKFNQTGMPKSRTGLVPRTYQKRMDALSRQEEWTDLPTRPRPELYQFRGDYVNERNRRNRAGRTLAVGRRGDGQQQKRPLATRPGVDDSDENKAPNPRKWDSYCAHISCHALAREQETRKARNKLKVLAFLRSASSKRSAVPSSRSREKKEEDRSQKSKKPPVPRQE